MAVVPSLTTTPSFCPEQTASVLRARSYCSVQNTLSIVVKSVASRRGRMPHCHTTMCEWVHSHLCLGRNLMTVRTLQAYGFLTCNEIFSC